MTSNSARRKSAGGIGPSTPDGGGPNGVVEGRCCVKVQPLSEMLRLVPVSGGSAGVGA
jgi:hypothetical protein